MVQNGMPHNDEINHAKDEVLKATTGKPGEHPAHVGSLTPELNQALNEGSAFKANFAHHLDSAAAFFLSDNVGLPGVAWYFKLMAVVQRADSFNLVKWLAKRGGSPTFGAISRFDSGDWSHKDKSDVLAAFACALATAKVGLSYANKTFQLVTASGDGDAASFISKACFAWTEQVKELSDFVAHLKLTVGNPHAIKNFDRELAYSRKTMDLAKAASIEAVAPPEVQMGVYTRLRRCQAAAFETALETHGKDHGFDHNN